MASNIATTEIPNQMNLQKTANSFDSNRQSIGMVTSALTAFVNNLKKYNAVVGNIDINKTSKTFMSALNIYVDTVKKLQDVEIKALKKMPSEKTFQNITSTFKNIMAAMKKGFADMSDSLGKDASYDKLLKLLTPQKEIVEEKNTNDIGVGIIKTTTNESGTIMDSLNLILNVYSQLGNIEKTGPLKGLIKGKMIVKRFKNQVLDTFINIFDLCINEFEKYDVTKVQNIYEAVKSVDKITIVLGQLLQKLSEPAVIIGSQKHVLLRGFNLLIGSPEETADTVSWIGKQKRKIFGKAKHHNLLGVIGIVFDTFVELNEKHGRNAQKAFRNINDLTESLIKITTSFALLGILAIPAIIGMKVLVGLGEKGKFSIINGLIRIMNRLAQAKDVQTASKNLLLISGAVMLLSGAITLMALTGMMIITNWANIAITGVATLILVALVGFLGSKVFKKEIQAGTKSLLLLSAAIMLLTMTAIAIVYTGQFICASWESVLQVELLIVTLGFTMWLLSLMQNTFEDAGKSILLMVAAVSLIGLTAVFLVRVSSLLAPNWVNLLIVFGVIVIMAGIVRLVDRIMEDVKDMTKILLFSAVITILSVAMLVLGMAANMINSNGGIKTFLVIAIGMVAVVTVFAGLVKFLGKLPVPVLLAGVIALTAICGLIILINSSILMLANAVKTITETAKMVKDEDWGDKSIASYILKPMLALMEASKIVAAMTPILLLATPAFASLFLISSSIGHMAKVVRDIATLNMPVEFNKDGKAIKYEKMKPEDFARAAENGAGVAKIFMALFGWKATTLNILGTKVTIEPIKLTEMSKVSRFARKRMKRLNKIVGFIGNMAQTVQDIAALRIPVFDKKTGEQKGYQRMTPQDFVTASENACTIAKTLVGMFSDVKFRAVLWSIDEDSAETMGIVLNSVGNLSNVLNVVATLASGKIPLSTEERDGKMVVTQTIEVSEIMKQSSTVSDNIKELIMCVVRGVVGIDEDMLDDAEDMVKDLNKVVESAVNSTTSIISLYKDNLKDLDVDDLNKKYEGTHKTLSGLVGFFEGKKFTNSNASAFTKQVTSLTNVLKQVDKTDLNKLKYAYSLVSKLADFAKSIRGDFDKLAECISEDLIAAIEKLNETFEGTSKNLNISSTSTADFTPNKSGTDAESKSSSTDNKNIRALQAQIEALQRELESYKQQSQPQRLKVDPSTGAVVVKMLN